MLECVNQKSYLLAEILNYRFCKEAKSTSKIEWIDK